MKKMIIFLCFFGALLISLTSCDSLWVVRDDASVIFDLNLKEVIGSGITRSRETSLLHSKSLIPDIADEGYDVFVSLHTASSDKVIASDTLTVEEAESSNIVFEGIATNETVYAKIEIAQNDRLIFRARSLDTKLKRGENLLIARPNAMFISWAGLSASLGGDPLDIESEVPFGLKELQFAYEYMSIDGKLLQDSTVYVSQSLSLKESEETWTFPGLSVVFENGLFVDVAESNTLTLQNISLIGEEIVVSVPSTSFLNLSGNLHVDGIMYNPTVNPLKVTGNISSNSRIILVPIDNDPLTAGTVLVEKASGNFSRDNFIVQGGINAIIDKDTGNLVVADEDSGDDGDDGDEGGENPPPPDGQSFTVTFISDGATTSGTVTTQTTVNGKIASLPIPEETGYTLVGWYITSNLLDQDENTAFTSSSVVTGDMSVYTWWILDTSVQNNLKNAKLTLNETGDSFSLALTGSFSGNTYDAPAEYQGKNITKISENGFSGYAVIETIRLRNTITEIGANAFSSLQTWATVSAVNGQGTLAGFSSTETSITAEFATWKEIPADTVVYPIWQ